VSNSVHKIAIQILDLVGGFFCSLFGLEALFS
jgi:hypothetical protein